MGSEKSVSLYQLNLKNKQTKTNPKRKQNKKIPKDKHEKSTKVNDISYFYRMLSFVVPVDQKESKDAHSSAAVQCTPPDCQVMQRKKSNHQAPGF